MKRAGLPALFYVRNDSKKIKFPGLKTDLARAGQKPVLSIASLQKHQKQGQVELTICIVSGPIIQH